MSPLVVDHIQAGRILGFHGEVPRLVSTGMSSVFLFRESKRVLKVYKRDIVHFRETDGGVRRRDFIREDFLWNHTMSPDIYTRLWVGMIEDSRIVLREDDGVSDELIIEMTLIEYPPLVDSLIDGSLTDSDYYMLGKCFTKAKMDFSHALKREIDTDWQTLLERYISDIETWMYLEEVSLGNNTIIRSMELLRQWMHEHSGYFSSVTHEDIVCLWDLHAENILYQNGKMAFIDTCHPMGHWRIGLQELDIYQLGDNIMALAGKTNFEAYIQGCLSEYPSLRRDMEWFYLLYSAALRCPYMQRMSRELPWREEMARRYLTHFRSLLYEK